MNAVVPLYGDRELLEARAAQHLLNRRRARASPIDYAGYIDIPGRQVTVSPDVQLFDPTGPHHLREQHKLVLGTLWRTSQRPFGRCIIMQPPGTAKALALDTPIPTLDGWRLMGELRINDVVFNERGQPCRVTHVSEIFRNRPVYRVRTDCGDEIVADGDHRWKVRLCGKRKETFSIKTTLELLKKRSKRPMIQRAAPLQLPDAALPVDPYLLGAWLGDGTSANMAITSGDEDRPWMRAEIERLGYATSDRVADNLFGVLGARHLFVNLGLLHDPPHDTYGRKHIPAIYMRASVSQRLALVQGLIDTDGTIDRRTGAATFCNTNRELAESFRELVRSLGRKAWWTESRAILNGKDYGAVYRVGFHHAEAARLPRKRALCRDGQRTIDTYVDVTEAGYADTVCIAVDSSSHLFLCGRSMTPTHNTTYGSITFPSWYLGVNPGHRLILSSYGADLAWSMGHKTRSIIRQARYKQIFGVELVNDSRAADHFLLSNFAEYHATGYNGDLPGRRAEGAVCDDIIKGHEEANSLLTREAVWQAYQNNIMPRLLTAAWLAMIATHWDEDDPFGRILPDTWAGDSGMFLGKDGLMWEVLCLQAQCETTTDPLGRQIGEYMQISDHFENDVKHFEMHKRDTRKWNALYQQRPRPTEGAFFHENDLLEEVGRDAANEPRYEPFDMPQRVDVVFAVIDSAVKTGLAHDGLAVSFFAYSKHNTNNRPLMWLDWDLTQIQGAFLNEWIPSIFTRLEAFAKICEARMGVAGAWVEDKVSGTILLQQAARRNDNATDESEAWPIHPIESKLTMMGKKERAVNVSGYVAAREVGMTRQAYERVVEYKGSTRNHALSQVLRFSPDSKDRDADDLLDTFTYSIAIGLGNPEGF